MEDAVAEQTTLPITTTISFITSVSAKNVSGIREDVEALNPVPTNITQDSHIAVVTLPPPGYDEQIENVAKWVSPLNSIWTFVAAISAVIIPLIIREKQKDQKEKEQKKDTD
jgi:hypothetical protein